MKINPRLLDKREPIQTEGEEEEDEEVGIYGGGRTDSGVRKERWHNNKKERERE